MRGIFRLLRRGGLSRPAAAVAGGLAAGYWSGGSASAGWFGRKKVGVDAAQELLVSADGKPPAEALALVTEALNAAPNYAPTLYTLCEVHVALRQWEEAEDAVRKALDLTPTAQGFVLLAEAMCSQGKNREALKLLRAITLGEVKAVKKWPSNVLAQVHFWAAVCSKSLGMKVDAAAHLSEACVHDPGSAVYRFLLGCSLDDIGDVKRAVQHLEEAVKMGHPGAGDMLELVASRLAMMSGPPRRGRQ
eukprot:TRINITY_DN33146_c0_g1_i1.p1 TRINITY_DN33146_c0_g1~~TRINITY_DN33146_c0_g1_i1.p1  ORF type:complete len:247 (+),score=66.64 TRINITY_DN33146_c0_g1_i1:101-841(+)